MKRKNILLIIGMSICLMSCMIGCAKKEAGTTDEEIKDIIDNLAGDVIEDSLGTTEEVTPAADETMEEALLKSSVANIDSYTGSLTMSVKMKVPMNEQEKKEYESLGNDPSFAYHDININTNVVVDTTDTLTHYNGSTNKEGDVVSSIAFNMYTDSSTNETFDLQTNKSVGTQVWVKNSSYTESLLSITRNLVSNIQKPVLNSNSKSKIVKGVISSTYLNAIPCLRDLNKEEYFVIDTSNNTDLSITATINTSTGFLTSIEIDIKPLIASALGSGAELKAENLKLTLTQYNSVKLEIPTEARNTTGETQSFVTDNLVYTKYFRSNYGHDKDITVDIAYDIVKSICGDTYDVLLLNKNYTPVMLEDGTEDTSNKYTAMMKQICNFLEFYSEDDLKQYVEYYKFESRDKQVAVCIVAKLGIPAFNEIYMQEHCIGNDTLDLVINSYITEIE